MKAVVVRQLGPPAGPSLRRTSRTLFRRRTKHWSASKRLASTSSISTTAKDSDWGGHHKRSLPYTPGAEGAGRVVAIGAAVTEISVGDRVAFGVSNGYGAYAELIAVKSDRLVKVPETVEITTAGAVMQQGMTAHYLTNSTYPLKATDVAVVHAAAGGTGLLVVQMAKLRGARVIGIVSSERKADMAKRAGADHTIITPDQGFEAEVRQLTDGGGVNVVYDSVGKATFEESLDCLAPLGMMVLYGQSSGPVPPFDTAVLNARGSLLLARPSLTHYVANRADLEWRSADIFRWIGEKKLDVRIDQIFPFSDAPRSHELLASRQSIGKILLVP